MVEVDEEIKTEEFVLMVLFFNFFMGISLVIIIKVMGFIYKNKVVVMLDRGVIYNFILLIVVEKYKLLVY